MKFNNNYDCLKCYIEYKRTNIDPVCDRLIEFDKFKCLYHAVAQRDIEQARKYNAGEEYLKDYDGKPLSTFDISHLLEDR